MVKLRNLFRHETPTLRARVVCVRATRQTSDRDEKTLLNAYAKRDTWRRWFTANPVLARGEIGVVLDDYAANGVRFFAIGDGVKTFRELRLYYQ